MRAFTKSVQVEAVQWNETAEVNKLIRQMFGGTIFRNPSSGKHWFTAPELGTFDLTPGCWLVKTENLGMSVLTKEEFESSYMLSRYQPDLEPGRYLTVTVNFDDGSEVTDLDLGRSEAEISWEHQVYSAMQLNGTPMDGAARCWSSLVLVVTNLIKSSPVPSLEDWREEVSRGDTQRGYVDWVSAKREEEEPNGD